MKKLMTACAVCLIGGWVSAQIPSVNIVGYMTQTISQKNNMIGLNFGTVGIEGGAIPVQDVIPGNQAGLKTGPNAAVADNIQVLGDSGYTVYYLSNGVFGKINDPAVSNKWVESGASVATAATIPVGGAFWYISQNGLTSPFSITLAGQVAQDATLTRQIKAGLNMIASGYAYDIVLNAAGTGLNLGKVGTNAGVADSIQVLADGAYTVYYLSNGVFGKINDPAVSNTWVESGASVATDAAVPAGAAAWYINRGSEFTWNHTRPYSL